MITKIINGRVLVDRVFCALPLYLQDGAILAIGGEHPYDTLLDAAGDYVTPGFIDLHCHGGGGADFTDGTPDAVCAAARLHAKHGTTTLFPTLLSADTKTLEKALSAIEEARPALPNLGGIHIEGPYFSPAQTGAQNANALRTPQKEEYLPLLEKYSIARWDYAPELDPDGSFLSALLSASVLPAAAHTDATCEQMLEAAAQGCRLITHLYSCTSTIRRENGFRVAGVTEAAYLSDDICAELIADGCHLPPSLLRLAYKLKGAERLALVTDAMRAAGIPAQGIYDLGGVSCLIEDGVAKLTDRTAFAGSIATADRLLRTVLAAGISVEEGVRMLTETPARLAGLSRKGVLREGYDASIVIFNKEVALRAVFVKGERVL